MNRRYGRRMRVLVIEDEPEVQRVLRRGLEAEGCAVEVVADGEEGIWAEAEGRFDVVLLDLLLPTVSGYQVCETIRARGSDVPILVLTAKSGDYDQIDLLDLGADDFLTKPVSIHLLVARMRALVRRAAGAATNELTVGEVTFDLDTRRCRRSGTEIELTAKETDVLLILLRAHPTVVSRSEMLIGGWGIDFEGDPGTVDVYVNRLRKKLGRDAIRTVRGVGFGVAG